MSIVPTHNNTINGVAGVNGNSSIGSLSATNSSILTNKAINQLMKQDAEKENNGGDPDIDGDGEFLVDIFNDLMIEYLKVDSE